MSDELSRELLTLTRSLLESIQHGDWEMYTELCDASLTAFEPEGRGHLVEGLDFHRFYFERGGHLGSHDNTIAAPHVRLLGDDAAIVSYVRLIRQVAENGPTSTVRCEETRVWQLRDGKWRHVHFHRSRPDG